ncbi:MAG: hypothetical protein U0U46_07700 [Saprospiraceae bacterium]
MKYLNVLEAERAQILQRLHSDKQNIRQDIAALRESLQPLESVTKMLGGATAAIAGQPLALEAGRLGAAFLPGKLGRNKWVSLAVQIAIPLMIHQAMKLVDRKTQGKAPATRLQYWMHELHDVWRSARALFRQA